MIIKFIYSFVALALLPLQAYASEKAVTEYLVTALIIFSLIPVIDLARRKNIYLFLYVLTQPIIWVLYVVASYLAAGMGTAGHVIPAIACLAVNLSYWRIISSWEGS